MRKQIGSIRRDATDPKTLEDRRLIRLTPVGRCKFCGWLHQTICVLQGGRHLVRRPTTRFLQTPGWRTNSEWRIGLLRSAGKTLPYHPPNVDLRVSKGPLLGSNDGSQEVRSLLSDVRSSGVGRAESSRSPRCCKSQKTREIIIGGACFTFAVMGARLPIV